MAALEVLEELGMRDAFSYVIGSSAGAINGAYFLAGQAQESLSIYYEELAGREFVSLRRFWKIVDIDYLVDDVLKRQHPLNENAMRAAPASLLTVLTDAESAEATTISNRVPGVDIYELFRATAALPGLYNRKVPIGERRFVDGGVADLVPVSVAFTRAKQAVVLLTREAGYRKPMAGPTARWSGPSHPGSRRGCRKRSAPPTWNTTRRWSGWRPSTGRPRAGPGRCVRPISIAWSTGRPTIARA
jgi:predicted patatin/cPLA2 family phospholipase